jgi:hypothetical protein
MAGIKINILSNFNAQGFSKLQRELKRLDTPIEKLGAVTRSLAPAAQIGLVALTALGASAIRAAEDAQVADRRLASVADSMNLFGTQTDAVTKRLRDFADATMKQTAVDDEVIKSTQAKLLTFRNLAKTAGVMGGAMDRATLAAIDMAATGFGSAESNAVALGKALNDPIKGVTALTRMGIQLTQEQKNMVKAMVETREASAAVAVGLFENERSYNDFIKAQVKAGEGAKSTARFFRENLTPAQHELFMQLKSTSDVLGAQDLILKEIETQVGGTAAATATASAKMAAAFGEMQEAIGNALLPILEKVVPVITGLFDFIAKNSGVVSVLAGIFGALAVAILAVNFALNANPIVKVITLVAALAAGAVILVNYLVNLAGGWAKLFEGIQNGLTEVGKFFGAVFDGISNLVVGVINGLATRFENFINTIISGLNGIISLANAALAIVSNVTGGAVNIQVPKVPTVSIPKMPVKTPSKVPTKIPKLALGGIVMPQPGGVLANIAEAGQAEAVIPLNKMDRYTNNKPQNVYNINVNGGVGSGSTIGRAIVEAIKSYERTSGAVFVGA